MNIYMYLNEDNSVAGILDIELSEATFTPMQELGMTVIETTTEEVEMKLPDGYTINSLAAGSAKIFKDGDEFSFDFNVIED